MAENDIDFITRGYEAFARGDIDGVAEMLAPDVTWHAAGDDEGGCRNRDEALTFIRRAAANGISADVLDVRDAGGRFVVTLQRKGDEPHAVLVAMRDGKVVEMVFYESPGEALAAAGG